MNFNYVIQSRFTGPVRGIEWTSDLALALDFPSRDAAQRRPQGLLHQAGQWHALARDAAPGRAKVGRAK
jgi:hypothetical protein